MVRQRESHPRLVLVTAPDIEIATMIARTLVEDRLAACANILPGLTSVYRWEGEVQEEAETLIIVKTRADHVERIEERLGEIHPYDVPECIALAPDRVEAKYLAWLIDATT